eukprot:gene14899-16582_t
MISQFPDDLFSVVLEFLFQEDQFQFAACSHGLYDKLMKGIRKNVFNLNEPYSASDRASLVRNVKDCYRQLDFFMDEDYSDDIEIEKNMLNPPSHVFHSTSKLYEKHIFQYLLPPEMDKPPKLSLDRLYSLSIQHINGHIRDKEKTLKMFEYFAMKNQFRNLGLKELSLYFFDLLDTLPFIPNLHSLHLVLFETLTKIPNEYVAKEGDLPMRPFNPRSVQQLPERLLAFSLQELTLTNRSIASSDIPLLGSVPCLRLENIDNLKSLEGLGRGNKSVYIKDCWGVSDFTPLKSVLCVSIEGCRGLTDGSQLNEVKELTIRNCANLVEYSSLVQGHVHHLRLVSTYVFGGSELRSFAGLGKIAILDIHRMSINYSISSLDDLGEANEKIIFPSFVQIPEFDQLSLKYHVLISRYLRELTLTNRSIASSDIPLLGSVPCLRLENIDNLKSLEGLGRGNKSVYIKDCWGVSDFTPLKSVPCVSIEGCRGLTDGSQLNEVKELAIRNCANLVEYSSLGQGHVHHLRLVSTYIFGGSELRSFAGLGKIAVLDISEMIIDLRISSLADLKIIFPSFLRISGFEQLSLKYHILVNKDENKRVLILKLGNL